MNSIYNTAAAAAHYNVPETNNEYQPEPQSQRRRDHPPRRRHPRGPSPTQPPTVPEPHPQRKGISASIKAIINDRQFRPAKENDSVHRIAEKLQFIIN